MDTLWPEELRIIYKDQQKNSAENALKIIAEKSGLSKDEIAKLDGLVHKVVIGDSEQKKK